MGKKITTIVQIMGQVDPSLKNAFSDVQKKARDVNKNLRETNRALKLNPSSFELITQKQQYLQQATLSAKEKLDQERQTLESLRAMPQTEEVIEQQRKLEREIVQTEAAYNRVRKEAVNYYSDIGNRFHQLAGWQKKAGDKLTQFGRSAMSISGPAMLAIGWAGKTTATFDNKMSRVKAITGETGKTFQQMRQYAIKMGNDTVFSASQVADAMSNMGMAGWKFKDMKQGGKSVVDLSAAFGIEPEKATEIVTGNLAALKMPVSQASTLVNQLAAAAANSNTDVLDLGESLKYVGTVAGAFGYSSKDTINALGVMANANIKGSMAGTSLRNILTSMTKDWTFYNDKLGQVTVKTRNADGTMRNFGDVIADLQKKTEGMTKAQKVQLAESIAGKRGMAALLQLMATDPVNMAKNKQLKDALDTANQGGGKAAKMAIERVNNIPGQLTLLKSKLQTAGIQLFDALTPTILNGLKIINKGLEDLNTAFANSPNWVKNLTAKGLAVAALIGPIATGAGKILSFLSPISNGIGNIFGKGKLLKTILKGGNSPLIQALAGSGFAGKLLTAMSGSGFKGKLLTGALKMFTGQGFIGKIGSKMTSGLGKALLKGMSGSGLMGKMLSGLAGKGLFKGLLGEGAGGGILKSLTSLLNPMTKGSNAFGGLAAMLGEGGGTGILGLLKAIPIQAKIAMGAIAAIGIGLAIAWPSIQKAWDKHKVKKNDKQAVNTAANKYAQAKVNYETGKGSKSAMVAAEKSYQQTQQAYTKKYGKPLKVKAHAQVDPEDQVKLKKKASVKVDVSDATTEIKRAASTGKSQKAKIKIDVDLSGVDAKISALNDAIKILKSNAKGIKVTVDTGKSAKKVKTIKDTLKKIKNKKVKVTVSGGGSVKSLRNNLSKLKNKHISVKVRTSGAGSLKSMQKSISALGKQKITIHTPNTSAALSAVRRMRNNIRSILASIGHIRWKISRPRIPRFHMSGTFNPETGSVPRISVSWYKSAMQLGAILKKPTIFGIGQNGRMLGAGEAGDEAVVGTSSLYRMVQRAAQSVAQPNVYNSYNMDEQEKKPDWLMKSMELQRNPVYINSDSPTPNYADSAANIEMGGITFAPNITMAPSETQPEDVIRALKRYMPQFMDSVETELRRREDGRLVSENAGL